MRRKPPPSIPPSTGGSNRWSVFRSDIGDDHIVNTDLANRDRSSGWFKSGTLVLTVSKGSATRTGFPHSFAFREQISPFDSPVHGAEYVPSPLTGRDREGASCRLPHVAGVQPVFSPIESLRAGDLVLGHDGQPHRVTHLVSREHCGNLICLRTKTSQAGLWITQDAYVLCANRTRSYGANRSWKQVSDGHFGRAIAMRKQSTNTESFVWRSLRGNQLGVSFRRQHPIGPYIVDFYSWETGLVVEIDGDSHFTVEGQAYDAERTAYLEALGLTVVRFTNAKVLECPEEVIASISYVTGAVKLSEDHYRQWRRANSLREGDIVFCASGETLSESSGQPSSCPQSSAFAKESPPRSPRQQGEVRPLPVDGEGQGGGSSSASRQDHGGILLREVSITSLERALTSEMLYHLEIESSSSLLTDVCVVHD